MAYYLQVEIHLQTPTRMKFYSSSHDWACFGPFKSQLDGQCMDFKGLAYD